MDYQFRSNQTLFNAILTSAPRSYYTMDIRFAMNQPSIQHMYYIEAPTFCAHDVLK